MPNIIIYTKPMCPYCDRAKQLLQHRKLHFREIRVDEDPVMLEHMIAQSGGRRTVPQIFINGRHIGGFDDLYALEKGGNLDVLLTPV